LKQSVFTIQSNERLTESVCKMVLAGDTSAITAAGQFVNIQLKGFFLRRPISVCDYDENTLTILYKIVGKGTEAMSKMKAPHKLDILTGLGNGYDTSKSGDKPLLIGGGVGVPPMYRLAKNLLAEGKKPIVILGFNTKDEIFYAEEFKALGGAYRNGRRLCRHKGLRYGCGENHSRLHLFLYLRSRTHAESPFRCHQNKRSAQL